MSARWRLTGMGAVLAAVVSLTAWVRVGRTEGEARPAAPAVPQSPQRITSDAAGIGRQFADLEFTTIDGKRGKLSDYREARGIVVAMTSTSCPLSKKYLPALARLEQTGAEQKIVFLFVNPIESDKLADMQAAIAAQKLKGPYVHDRDGRLAAAVRASTTTETILLDPSRTVIYRGAIDDRYGLGYAKAEARHEYLAEAIRALLAGKTPAIAATAAPGCALDVQPPAENAAAQVTYHNRISRIVQAHCVECHREGGAAPFKLDTPADVAAHKAMIRQVVEQKTMPPWFAATPADGSPSPWSNDRSLSPADKADFLAWLAGDLPVGNAADSPPPRTFAVDGWTIGKPDAVFALPRAVDVPAEGVMPYQNLTIETELGEDKWIQALEIRPTAREVVHHVLVTVQSGATGEAGGQGRADNTSDDRRGFFAVYVPGNSTLVYPQGFAKRLPKGARLRFQMHYTPNGAAVSDQTQLGIVFAKEPPEHEVHVTGILNGRISIPPGAANHAETAKQRIPADVRILAFLPHMHLRGKAFRIDVVEGDKRETLLDVPRYDFNWQLLYRYADPRPIPQGATLELTAWYDNSADNPANPDPTKTVRWGAQTFEEMMLGYVEFYVPAQKLGGGLSTLGGAGAMAGVFERLDKNGDNKLTPDELPRPELFKQIDADGDGFITREEGIQFVQKRAR